MSCTDSTLVLCGFISYMLNSLLDFCIQFQSLVAFLGSVDHLDCL